MDEADKLKLIFSVMLWIRDNLDNELNVKVVSNKSGYSRRYFQKLFKENVGVTIKEYILHIRINRATELLVLPQKTINSISFEVGFSSHQSFSRAFKRAMHQTPRDFRQVNIKLSHK
ncbi:helix-turn-helix transcriptional regulator [Serratia sp. JKS296]|uniref:helix-turn-helix transcriptional regulator n=1 Tax=Serratia sp. JKS296 TaxID=1938824 RepID=UPI000BE28043|nr:AraC family transcriptional regulator [Serratia sp. JKS296]